MSCRTERNIVAVLEQAGFCSNRKITDTLQGSVWSSRRKQSNESVIIKVTSRKLHQHGLILLDGQKYAVQEDILKEKDILKYLSVHGQSKEVGSRRVVKYYDFFKSNSNFYFVMEHGGHMLFDFVVRVHRYIESGKLDVAEWRAFVRVLFAQIVDAVQFIHRHGVCHYDISLENILINDVEVVLDHDGKIKFCADTIDVKLCDFGLAERESVNEYDDDDEKTMTTIPTTTATATTLSNSMSSHSNSRSTKFCGKPNYKSPECTKGEPFNAKQNDTWCVGVCLYMMVIGGNLYNTASKEDKSFVQVMDGKLGPLLTSWKRRHYVDEPLLDLLQSIFRGESDRASLDDIARHPWVTAKGGSSSK